MTDRGTSLYMSEKMPGDEKPKQNEYSISTYRQSASFDVKEMQNFLIGEEILEFRVC